MGLDFNAFQMGQQAVGDPVTEAMQRQQGQLSLQAQGLQNQGTIQQMQMQKAALQRQQQYTQDVQAFAQKPSVNGLAALWKYPEFQASTKGIYDQMDPRMRQQEVTQLGSVASLLQSNDLTGASKIVQSRIDADKAAGLNTTGDEQALAMINSGDPKQINAAKAMIAGLMAGSVGFDKAAEYLKAIGLSQEPIDVAMDHRLVTAQGKEVVAATPKLELATNPITGQSTFGNPYTGKFGAEAVDGGQSTEGGGQPSGAGATTPPPAAGGANVSPAVASVASTLASSGLPAPVVAGFMGNFHAEGGYSGAQGDGGSATGIAQWHSDRASMFQRVIGKPVTEASPAEQAKFVAWEMQNPEAAGMTVKQRDAIMAAKTPAQAAALIDQYYERSSGKDRKVRMAAASAFASNGTPAAPAASGQSAPQAVGNDPYTFGGVGLNTKEAPPGYAWNADRTGVVPIPGSENDPNASDPQEIDDLARNWLTTGQWAGGGGGMGGGNIPNPLKKQAMAHASELMKSIGITAADLPKIRSEFGAYKTSLGNVTGLLSNLQASENALHTNAQQVWNYHQKLRTDGIIGDNPIINRQKLKYYANFGSPDEKAAVKGYRDAINAYSTEYSKFMTSANGMGGSGGPSDAARDQSGQLNDEGMPATAMLQHLRQGEVEAANKRDGVAKQKTQLETQLASLLQPHSSPHAPATHTAPKFPVNIPQGAVQMLKTHPELAPQFDQKYGLGVSRQVLGH